MNGLAGTTVAERSYSKMYASARNSINAANERHTPAASDHASRDGQCRASQREPLVLAEGELIKAREADRSNITQSSSITRSDGKKCFPNPVVYGRNPTPPERVAIISNCIALERTLPRRPAKSEKSTGQVGYRHRCSLANIRHLFPKRSSKRMETERQRQTRQLNITRMSGNTDSAPTASRNRQWRGPSTFDNPVRRNAAPNAMTKSFAESLSDPSTIIVADASVIIYLNKTGFAKEILGNMKCHCIVPEIVSMELQKGRKKGNKDFDYLRKMEEMGILEIRGLGDSGASIFHELNNKATNPILTGGEAAVIGLAEELSGTALIDEKRGRKVCQKYYPNLSLGSTTEILLSPVVSKTLGPSKQANVLHHAIQVSRLSVPDELKPSVTSYFEPKKPDHSPYLPDSSPSPE